MGFVRAAKLMVDEESFDIMSEAKAKRVGWGRGYTRAAFVFILQQRDTTVLNALYAYTTTSAGSFQGANNLLLPSVGRTTQPGPATAGSALLFAPDDISLPATCIHAPFYSHGGKKYVDNAIDKLREESVVVLAGEDAAGLDVTQALLENLSLT